MNIRNAVQEMLNYFPAQLTESLPKLKITVKSMNEVGDGEAEYDGNGKISIRADLNTAFNKNELQRVLFHEMMHWIHLEGPRDYRLSIHNHYMKRTVGEKVVHLPGYGDDVVGRIDRWYDAYAGRNYDEDKVYPRLDIATRMRYTEFQGVEVPTIYIEALTWPPEELANAWNKDPDFRETFLIVLNGSYL